MIKLQNSQMIIISPLFAQQEDTLILSCLQGHMGEAWVDNFESPSCSLITVADFAYFGGDSDSDGAMSLVKGISEYYKGNFIIMLPPNDGWAKKVESYYSGNYKKISRYSIKKEPNVFNPTQLQYYVDGLPEGFKLIPIDEKLYDQSLKYSWSSDFCSSFSSYDDYKNRGLGYAIMHNNQFVCGASTYTIYDEGIEIEIDTREDYRQLGLATACGARLILECLSRGLYPSWDAASEISVSLAEKFGYHLNKEYTAYFVDLV